MDVDNLSQIREKTPLSSNLSCLRAEIHRRKKEFRKAERIYRNILLTQPKDLRAHKGLVRTFFDQRKNRDAEPHLSQVLESGQRDLLFLKDVAAYFIKEKKVKKALRLYEMILEMDPFCKEALFWKNRSVKQPSLLLVDQLILEKKYQEAYEKLKTLKTKGLSPEVGKKKILFKKSSFVHGRRKRKKEKIKILKRLLNNLKGKS